MGINFEEKTIEEFLNRLNEDIYLPYIQREYVWDETQIIKLFDSILKEFPIGTFLVWNKKLGDSVAYEFPRTFIMDGIYAPDEVKDQGEYRPQLVQSEDVPDHKLKFVLDGQQRLTSLYIGLMGSIIQKKGSKSVSSPSSWVENKLYIDLLSRPDNNVSSEIDYKLEFKSNPSNTDGELWFCLSDVLDKSRQESWEHLEAELEEMGVSGKRIAKKTHRNVYKSIKSNSVINYYNYRQSDYESVIEMFVRTNTSGESLDKTDILLSICTKYWLKRHSSVAREEITRFVEDFNLEENQISSISPKFVLRNLLFCSDNNINFAGNFSEPEIEDMYSVWNDKEYRKSYHQASQFLERFNLTAEDISGSFSIHILIYFFYQVMPKGLEPTNSEHNKVERKLLYLLCVIRVKSIYNGASNTKLDKIRSVMKSDGIDLSKIDNLLREVDTSLEISIENVMDNVEYSDPRVKCVLCLMYLYDLSAIKNHSDLEIDHIYPKQKNSTNDYVNSMYNLQYLTKRENQNKEDMDYKNWIEQRNKNYKEKNKIPELDSYADNMDEFIKQRKKLIIDRINKGDNNEL